MEQELAPQQECARRSPTDVPASMVSFVMREAMVSFSVPGDEEMVAKGARHLKYQVWFPALPDQHGPDGVTVSHWARLDGLGKVRWRRLESSVLVVVHSKWKRKRELRKGLLEHQNGAYSGAVFQR